jgi:hypothetical protein
MKTLKKLLATVLLLVTVLTAVTSCYTVGGGGHITIVVAGDTTEEYGIWLENVNEGGLIAALDYLENAGRLSYTSEDAGYGAYLTEVGNLKQDAAAGKYIYIWTSVEKDFDVSAYATTVEYKGKSLTSCGVGASFMTLEDGAVIYISYVEY